MLPLVCTHCTCALFFLNLTYFLFSFQECSGLLDALQHTVRRPRAGPRSWQASLSKAPSPPIPRLHHSRPASQASWHSHPASGGAPFRTLLSEEQASDMPCLNDTTILEFVPATPQCGCCRDAVGESSADRRGHVIVCVCVCVCVCVGFISPHLLSPSLLSYLCPFCSVSELRCRRNSGAQPGEKSSEAASAGSCSLQFSVIRLLVQTLAKCTNNYLQQGREWTA